MSGINPLPDELRRTLKSAQTTAYRASLDLFEGGHGRNLDRALRGKAPLTDDQLATIIEGLDLAARPGDQDVVLTFANISAKRALRPPMFSSPQAETPAHLDVIGMGALNYDHVTPLHRHRRSRLEMSLDSFDRREQHASTEADIDRVLRESTSASEATAVAHSLGGSAFNVLRMLLDPSLQCRTGFVGVSGAVPEAAQPSLAYDHYTLLTDMGCDTRFVRRAPDIGGRCVSTTNRQGAHSVIRHRTTWSGANDLLFRHLVGNYEAVTAFLSSARIVYLTPVFDPRAGDVIAGLIEDAVQRNPALVLAFDPGDKWSHERRQSTRRILASATLLFVNRTELDGMSRGYAGNIADPTDARRAEAILARMRQAEREPVVLVVSDAGEVHEYTRKADTRAPSRKRSGTVERTTSIAAAINKNSVVDDTGAGDAFAAGYLGIQLSLPLQTQMGIAVGLLLARSKLSALGGLPLTRLAELSRTVTNVETNVHDL